MDFHKDDRLIERVQLGDEEAFNLLYEKYYKTMLYTAYRFTNNIEDAKDAVQAAFLQMYKSIGNLKDPKYFRLWMNKIVRGKCIDMFHKNKDLTLDVTQEVISNKYAEHYDDFIPHEKLKFVADHDILMGLIDELPMHYQEILLYAYFSQFSMKEMADVLQIPEGTVKSRLFAAKKSLRDKITRYEETNHYKITFHLPGILPLHILLSFHKQAALLDHKRIMIRIKPSTKIKTALCVLLISLFGTGVMAQLRHNTDSEKKIETTSHTNATQMNAQEAYFTLKQWAADGVQMSEKNQTEIEEIMPIYEFLKQQEGAYWERIQKDQWDIAFETILNKNK